MPDAANASISLGDFVDMAGDMVLGFLKAILIAARQPQGQAVAVGGHRKISSGQFDLCGQRVVPHRKKYAPSL